MTKFLGRNNKSPIIGLSYRPYSQDVRKLKKTYRNIESDLNEMYERIAKNPKQACGATPVQGAVQRIWKYRCRSTDQARGSRGGFRVLCYLHESGSGGRGTSIVPLRAYSKSGKEPRFSRVSFAR